MVYPQQFMNPFMPMQNMGNVQMMNRNSFGYNNYMPTTTMNDFQVVNGRESAEMYAMPPNSRVILMDSELPRIYFKQTDAAGGYSIEAYDLVPAVEEQVTQPVDYVTREEFEKWKRDMINESSTSEQEIREPIIELQDEFKSDEYAIQSRSDDSTLF